MTLFALKYFCLDRFLENKREAGELAEKEGRKVKAEDYLYQYAGVCDTENGCS